MCKKIIKSILAKLRGEMTLDALLKRGLIIGQGFSMQSECIIDRSHCWLIRIGNNVTLAPRVHILAHDASTRAPLGYTKIGRVIIGNNVFIGANTTILPNVKIGDNVVIGAGSIVSKDIPNGVVVSGNPARVICSTEEYLSRNLELMKIRPLYGEDFTLRSNVTAEKKDEMFLALEDGIGYVV